MALETELKYLDVDLDAVRQTLHQAGGDFQVRYFEENEVFDNEAGSLRRAGALLRLRRGPQCLLTLKLPAGGPAGLKSRDERETAVADVDAARAILDGLGYKVAFRYEKVRETWSLAGCSVCLDHLPFGDCVELEGTPGAIRAAAERLGLAAGRSTDRDYHALHRDHLRRRGLPEEDGFVFPARERELILADL